MKEKNYYIKDSELSLLKDIFSNQTGWMIIDQSTGYNFTKNRFLSHYIMAWKTQEDACIIEPYFLDFGIQMQEQFSVRIKSMSIDRLKFRNFPMLSEFGKVHSIEVYKKKFEFSGHLFEFETLLKLTSATHSLLLEPLEAGGLPTINIVVGEEHIMGMLSKYTSYERASLSLSRKIEF